MHLWLLHSAEGTCTSIGIKVESTNVSINIPIFLYVSYLILLIQVGVCDSLVHMKIGLWTIVRFDAHLMDSKAATRT